jgi:hypothetical protein
VRDPHDGGIGYLGTRPSSAGSHHGDSPTGTPVISTSARIARLRATPHILASGYIFSSARHASQSSRTTPTAARVPVEGLRCL